MYVYNRLSSNEMSPIKCVITSKYLYRVSLFSYFEITFPIHLFYPLLKKCSFDTFLSIFEHSLEPWFGEQIANATNFPLQISKRI